MHLFMCSIIVGAKMLEDSIDIQHCYKETMVSNIVINMVIALTHDVGKLDCAVYHKERKFVGFPFHGQASAAFLLLFTAYSIASPSVVSPFEYSILLWSPLIGWLYFDEIPTISTLTGILIIVSSGIYIFMREKAQDQSIATEKPLR